MYPEGPPIAYVPKNTTIEVAGDCLCSWCYKPAGDGGTITLQRCSACRRVSYCSPACQKQDWKHRHKYFCPRFQEVNKYDREVVGDRAVSLADLNIHQTIKKRILLSKDPAQREPCEGCCDNIFKHEVVCDVCNRSPYQAAVFRPFDSCSQCNMVHYCSDACKRALSTVHSHDDCKILRLLRGTERTQIDYHIARQKPADFESLISVTPHARHPYVPLSHYANFGDFHRAISVEYSGSPDVTAMYRLLARSFHHHDPMVVQAIDQLASEAESIPLTVIAGLEACVPNINARRKLEIHFVGASSREQKARGITEEILHHFPSLQELTIHYVGPEAIVPPGGVTQSPNLACSSCKSRGASRRWALHATEYHDFHKANPDKRPDLIVGLNTGWSEIAQDAWARTFDAIAALRAPVLFTEYSQCEAREEEKLLRARGAEFVLPVQENRWKGVIPIVNKGIKFTIGQFASYSSWYMYVFRL